MAWMITGGAGYIGAHVVKAFLSEGLRVVVLDDLSTGIQARVPEGVPFTRGTVQDSRLVRQVLHQHRITGVVHMAAKKAVAESMNNPLLYYRENVGGIESLLEAMNHEKVTRLVFSSTAAVYGTARTDVVAEDAPTAPANPYGSTKLVCEQMLRHVGNATDLSWISLRFFNVAGTAEPSLADIHASNLIPMIFEALDSGGRPRIFGDNYPTEDGTCVRDYVHVADVADAHKEAAKALTVGKYAGVYNVGTGEGSSVRDVLRTVEHITGTTVNPEIMPRRAGDVPRMVGDIRRMAADFGWVASRGLNEMIGSAWEARKSTGTASSLSAR